MKARKHQDDIFLCSFFLLLFTCKSSLISFCFYHSTQTALDTIMFGLHIAKHHIKFSVPNLSDFSSEILKYYLHLVSMTSNADNSLAQLSVDSFPLMFIFYWIHLSYLLFSSHFHFHGGFTQLPGFKKYSYVDDFRIYISGPYITPKYSAGILDCLFHFPIQI